MRAPIMSFMFANHILFDIDPRESSLTRRPKLSEN